MTALYVNATTGSDSNPGTQAQPFKTIGAANAVATAGTTVHVAAGTYAEEITTSASGTASAPITFVSDTPGGAVIVPPAVGSTGFGWHVNGNYVTVQGFTVNGSAYQSGTQWNVGIYFEGSNDTASGDIVHDIMSTTNNGSQGAAGIDTDSYDGGTNDNVLGSTVYNVGPAGDTYDQGIYIGTSGEVENNLVHNVANVGIHLWHNATNVEIADNTSVDNTMGIMVGAGDYYASGSQGPDDYTNVFNNIVYGNSYGISEQGSTGTHNTYVNNLVYDNTNYNYSLQNGNTASGTMSADPKFIGGGNWHLQSISPAINGGVTSDAGISAPTTDLDGNTRSGAPDIGAYEYTTQVVSGGQTLTVSAGQTVNSVQVETSGTLSILSGGTASNTTVSGLHSNVNVNGGGEAVNTSINYGGTETVGPGGITVNPTIVTSAALNLVSGSIVSGAIDFTGPGGEMIIYTQAPPANVISGFQPNEVIDFQGLTFNSANTVSILSGNTLQVTAGGTHYNFNLDPAASYTGESPHLMKDSVGGTDIYITKP